MPRFARCAALLVCVLAPAASARPFHDVAGLEVGVNTRHFAAADPEDVAFRSTTDEMDPSLGEGTAVTTSLRFAYATPHNTYVGVEGEVGQLVGFSSSNFAGGYFVAGAHGDLDRVRLSAELVGGRRWVRYDLIDRPDGTKMIAEPRVRADLWLSPAWTLGAAVGATLSERQVWMAGVYVGLHDFPGTK